MAFTTQDVDAFRLPKTFAFMFFFPGENKFATIGAHARCWCREYTSLKKLDLAKGDRVKFLQIPAGIFICKVPLEHLRGIERHIDNKIEEGFELSKLDITNALEKACESLENENPSTSMSIKKTAEDIQDPSKKISRLYAGRKCSVGLCPVYLIMLIS